MGQDTARLLFDKQQATTVYMRTMSGPGDEGKGGSICSNSYRQEREPSTRPKVE